MKTFRNVLVSSLLALVLLSFESCCGVGPMPTDPGANGGTYVSEQGVVFFRATPVGVSEPFDIPIVESADTDETIVSARVTGPNADAFQVKAEFPLYVPRGESVLVAVQFAPHANGALSATLELETAKMGVSKVSLQGTGTGGPESR